MKDIRCLLGKHQLSKVKSFGFQDHKLVCKRCKGAWAMNDRLGVMVAWDVEMEEAYRGFEESSVAPNSELKKSVENELDQMWKRCSADGQPAIERANDIVDFCVSVGVLTDKDRELWKFRLNTCPNPEHIGQSWCAYCGYIPQEENVETI